MLKRRLPWVASASSVGRENHSPLVTAKNFLIHLRLHYQLLLSPIYLWGYFLTGARPDSDFWLGFLSFHIFLYGGGTAYNSYYDRDEGPVGGLAHPPPVHPLLLPFSLGVLFLGGVLGLLVNGPFLIVYLTMVLLGVAYTHPRIRWKARPLLGLAVVALGQGVLASLGGWLTAQPDQLPQNLTHWLGILAVTLVTTGFYPLTQIYQIEEDLSRGDRTFAAWAGPGATFIFSMIIQGLALILLVSIIRQVMAEHDAWLVAFFYSLIFALTLRWARHYHQPEVHHNFRWIMALNALTSTGFSALILAHLYGLP